MRVRAWGAWFVSALAHAAMAVLLLWLAARPRSPERAPPAPIELEIVERKLPRSQTERSAPAPPPPDRALGERREEHSSSTRHEPAEPRSAEPSPEGTSSPHADRAPESPAPAPGHAPDLSFRSLSPDAQARLAGPPPDVLLESRPRRPSVDELRVEVEREEDAVANVRAGRADPVLYDYLRGARRRFEDEATRLAEAIALGPHDTVSGWGRGYLQGVEEAHRASADDESPDLRDEATRRRPDLATMDDESRRQAAGGAEKRRVEICLDVAAGREPAATLRRGSGNAALDRVALESFAKSVAARPVPPDARTGRACYEVRIAAYRAPPLPFLSCGLDRTGVKCIWPFKKITSVTGRLLSVEYPPAPGAAASRSLLRRAR